MLAPTTHIPQRDWLWLALLLGTVLLAGIGLRDPWPADEPRFAQVAREMVESGQWLFPMRGGELYPDKPPVFMWMIAGVFLITGSLKIAFLLPSALSGIVTALAVFDLTRRLHGRYAAWLAVFTLLFTFQFILQAKTAQIDATVCMWITLGCCGVLRATLFPGQHRWWYAACVFMALGIMTKGVGFLPLLLLVPYSFLLRSQSATHNIYRLTAGQWLIGVMLLLATLAMWLLPMIWTVEASGNSAFVAYRDNILLKQTVTRYANAWHHIKPFWYYVTHVVPWAWLPVILLFPWLAGFWKDAFKLRRASVVMPLVFTVLTVLFFSISSGKRGVYILPALPMLVIAAAPFLKSVYARTGVRRLLLLFTLLISSVMIVLGGLALAGNGPLPALYIKHDVELTWWLIVTGAACAMAVLLTRRHSVAIWSAFSIVLWLSYSLWGAPSINVARTPHNIFEVAQRHLPGNAEVAVIDTKEQFILFNPFTVVHFGYHTPLSQQVQAAWQWQSEATSGDAPRWILMPDSITSSCLDTDDAIEAGKAHRERWLLLPPSARRPVCELTSPLPQTFRYQGQPFD